MGFLGLIRGGRSKKTSTPSFLESRPVSEKPRWWQFAKKMAATKAQRAELGRAQAEELVKLTAERDRLIQEIVDKNYAQKIVQILIIK